jgi:hypothetical protein
MLHKLPLRVFRSLAQEQFEGHQHPLHPDPAVAAAEENDM